MRDNFFDQSLTTLFPKLDPGLVSQCDRTVVCKGDLTEYVGMVGVPAASDIRERQRWFFIAAGEVNLYFIICDVVAIH